MKNKYVYRSKISESKTRQIIKLFSADLNALQIAELTHLNRNTINKYVTYFRKKIADYCEEQSAIIKYNIHKKNYTVDNKNNLEELKLFGLFRQDNYIYTEILPYNLQILFQKYMNEYITLDYLIQSEIWHDYDSIIDLKNQRHFRIKTDRTDTHTDTLENFWLFTKNRLLRFRGIHSQTVYFHIKECEFRFNNKEKDIYKIILHILR